MTRARRLEERLPALVAAWRSRQGQTGAGRAALSPAETRSAGRALLELQRGLTGSRNLPGSGYMDRSDLLGAYLLYYWPVSYLQVSLALAWLERLPGGRAPFARVLDLGAGPGPATAALLDGGAGEAYLLDSSRDALDLASAILSPAQVRTQVANLEDGLPKDLEPSFDLIVACHSLNELWKGEPEAAAKRFALLSDAAGLLSPGGILLVLEPALLGTSRDLLGLRDRLLASTPGLELLGPCTRHGPCPALAAGPAQTCHAEAAWQPPEPLASLAAEAGLDRTSIKTTWFAFEKKNPGNEGPRVRATRDALVVSEAMLNKAGRIRYLLCSEAGRFPLSARKDDGKALGQGFLGLGRYDRVRVVNPEPRGDPSSPGWGLGPDSALEILERAPSLAPKGNL